MHILKNEEEVVKCRKVTMILDEEDCDGLQSLDEDLDYDPENESILRGMKVLGIRNSRRFSDHAHVLLCIVEE